MGGQFLYFLHSRAGNLAFCLRNKKSCCSLLAMETGGDSNICGLYTGGSALELRDFLQSFQQNTFIVS
jgi:hypothetical protein